MGWETRGGHSYYYRKRWEDGRAVSEYVGAGLAATAADALDRMERYERETAAVEWRRVVNAERQAARALAEVETVTRVLTAAVLIANGYHAHKRQWRRARDEQSE